MNGIERSGCPGVRSLLFVAALIATAFTGRRAEACLFYDPGPEETQHIDPTATRVLFKQVGGRTTQILQVSYQGNASSFGWLIPVPARPEFDVVPQGENPFESLDYATAPTFRYGGSRGSAGTSEGGVGCGDAKSMSDSGGLPPDQYARVTVWESSQVGPYTFEVLTAASAADLLRWLTDNDYRVPPGAEPILQQYVDDGDFFVGVKLQPEAGEAAVRPIVLTYEGTELAVPIRLNQLTTLEDMGLLVYVLADRQAAPENYARVEISNAAIVVNEQDQTDNYGALVADAVDELGGGRAFVTEYAQPAAVLRQAVFDQATLELLGDVQYVTRLYTALDAYDMSIDPRFTFLDGPDVSNVHDLAEGSMASAERPSGSRAAGFGPVALVALARVFRRRRRAHVAE